MTTNMITFASEIINSLPSNGYTWKFEEENDFLAKIHSNAPLGMEYAGMTQPAIKRIAINVNVIQRLYNTLEEKFPRVFKVYSWFAGSKEQQIKKAIKNTILHEYRHSCQFNWLESRGYNPEEALSIEKESLYGWGALEWDANCYASNSMFLKDLNKVMSKFIKKMNAAA